MNTPTLVCFLSLLLISTLVPHSLSERCNPSDKKVLLQILKDFNNPYILASWKADTDCCDWYCVTCDDTTNRINSLTIFSGNLPGQIPDAVGDLPYLENLEFHHLTNLTGPIPSGLANLKKLKMITISYTNISGSVPAWLSQLNNLILLDLSFNQLSGTIPSSLSQLTNLLALHLDRNSLTGSIPESFGQFRGNIPDLYLSHNQLTGEIPASLGDLDFNIIDFSSNKLTGDASFLFGAKKTTIWVILSRNKLGFNLSEVEFASTLTNVDLNHNMIYGSIPEAVTALPLQLWNVSYNRLCGQIPQGGKMQTFDMYSYFHNKCLCGAPLASC